MPTWLIKRLWPVLSVTIANICNALFTQGVLPTTQVQCVVYSRSAANDPEARVVYSRSATNDSETRVVYSGSATDQKHALFTQGVQLTTQKHALFTQEVLPTTHYHAVVRPRLKKPTLDPDDLNSYQPISNFSFLSKTIERVMAAHFHEHVETHNPLLSRQLAYRAHHSTETAVIDVHNRRR